MTTKGKTFYQLVFDRTPFYGNSGGQVGDSGYIGSANERITIVDTQKDNNLTVHITETLPENPAADFIAVVDEGRRIASANNHSATHLLHRALRTLLGTHVEQKGSLVSPDYLRFDFSHFQKVTPEQIREVERMVNAMIRANYPLEENRNSTIDEARKQGAMMLFGEKYGEVVRTVRFGDSIELCGGTHASATGNIGYFRILSESAISAGVRRIEAVTGAKAEEFVYVMQDTLQGIQQLVNTPSVMQAVRKMFEDNAELHQKLEALIKEKIASFVETMGSELAVSSDEVTVRVAEVPFAGEHLRDVAFMLRPRLRNVAMVLGTKADGKVNLAVVLGDDVVARGLNASEIVREAAREIQGGGGGQPFFAMAGGKRPEGLDRAMEAAERLINTKLGR